MTGRRRFAIDLGLGLAALAVSGAAAQDDAVVVEGIRFPRSVTANGTSLTLHRAVLFRYRRIIKAYSAALYLGPGVTPAQVLDDVPKRLELGYHLGIDGEDFGPAAVEVMSRMHTPAQMARMQARLDRLHAAYRDVEEGDRYALTYAPGRGMELALNGTPLVTVPGDDLQRAYFSIWFGRDPIAGYLRDQLTAA